MNSSVIISTYQRPDALERTLASLALQIHCPHEVIVADDGSREPTADCVQRWQASAPFPVVHVWQEDRGFRAAAVRNRAAAVARGEYLIFLDGDCLAFPDFVLRHESLAEAGWFVAGNRVLLSHMLTREVLAGQEQPLAWGGRRWLRARLRGEVNRLAPLVALPGKSWRRLQPRKWKGARTCNFALWRMDFLALNGFDESYEGWGHEDADLAVRLIRSGTRRKDGRFATAVLHLWHPENPRTRESENLARLEAALTGVRETRAERGVSQYMPGAD